MITAAEAIGLQARELARYQDEPAQMPSRAVGKSGYLKLGFDKRGPRTILATLEQRVPYLVQRALYWDEALPGMPCVFVITTSGCVLQGDRLALDIALSEDAQAHVTTQAATKIHTMDANYAAFTQSIDLADRAYLELLPEPTIPHRGARFISDTRITIAPSATLVYADVTLCGRKHHRPDERFGFDLVSNTISAARPDGRALFRDKLVIDPASAAPDRAGVMAGHDVFATALVLTPQHHAKAIRDLVRSGVEGDVAWGASRLPADAGVIVRVLGNETEPVKAKLRELCALARKTVTRADAPRPFWR